MKRDSTRQQDDSQQTTDVMYNVSMYRYSLMFATVRMIHYKISV